jgi:long-chain acyl-CoA synthetase
MSQNTSHMIPVAVAATLDGLFRERVTRTSDRVAYMDYDEQHRNWRTYTWEQIDRQVVRWQTALEKEGLKAGDRVAVLLRNSPEWVIYDQAALGLGLVTVPLYTQDRPENVAYILNDSGAKVLLIDGAEQWQALSEVKDQLPTLVRVLTVKPVSDSSESRLASLAEWLPDGGGETRHVPRDPNGLATIVYTSGTTGHPKGVMLSHNNILSNVGASCDVISAGYEDLFLSFLPLSHTFERTCGYYFAIMTGATTAYCRGIPHLAEDLQAIRPTLLISVPRIYERVHTAILAKLDAGLPFRKKLFEIAVAIGYARFEHAQHRGPWLPSFLLWPVLNALVAKKILARLGGRLRGAISGGAALPPEISRVFLGLGLTVLQGYGMTEASPVICGNRPHDNVPASVGAPLPGIQVKLGAGNGLMIKGPNVMLGYWNNPRATSDVLGSDGWLSSGDIARIDAQGRVYITGRLKEIIVLSNGEKVSPIDVEAAIVRDPLFEQVMLLGEGKPFLSVIAVLNAEQWKIVCTERGLDPSSPEAIGSEPIEELLLSRIAAQMHAFPGYAQVRRASATLEHWTVENGILTPTMKLKRAKVMEKFNAEIDAIYAGH